MVKNSFVNTIAALATFAFCWSILAIFDEQTGRAGILAACFALGIVAYGIRAWPVDATFIDTWQLIRYFTVVLAIVFVLVASDCWFNDQQIRTAPELLSYLRTSFHTWPFLLAGTIFWVTVPFLFASIVRAATIGIMINVFGTSRFGMATAEEIDLRREGELKVRWLAAGGEMVAIAVMAAFWPGVVALNAFHEGAVGKGIFVFATWCIAYLGVTFWMHRRHVARMQVTIPVAVVAMAAAAIVIWHY